MDHAAGVAVRLLVLCEPRGQEHWELSLLERLLRGQREEHHQDVLCCALLGVAPLVHQPRAVARGVPQVHHRAYGQQVLLRDQRVQVALLFVLMSVKQKHNLG